MLRNLPPSRIVGVVRLSGKEIHHIPFIIIIIIIVVLHHRVNQDSSVGMVTMLRDGQPRVRSSIRGMAKTFFYGSEPTQLHV